MTRFPWFAGLAPAVLALAALPGGGEEVALQQVVVTNFPETQKVVGTVRVGQPIPATVLLSSKALVTTALPTQLTSLTEGPALDVTGYTSGTLSLAVEMKGSIAAPGKVGVILVPDVEEVMTALRESSVVEFPLTVEAPVAPSVSGLHQSSPLVVRFAFPSYRVFFFNTTPRTAEVTLYSYLSSS